VADQYHLDHPTLNGQVWALLTPDQKTSAILYATKLLDSQYVWYGSAVSVTQALQWPRIGLLTTKGFALPYNVIPNEIQWANAELARQLCTTDRTAEFDVGVQGITSIKAGSVALSFKDVNSGPPIIPVGVSALIPYIWGYLLGQSMMRPLVRG
jgi:hypothetical protein